MSPGEPPHSAQYYCDEVEAIVKSRYRNPLRLTKACEQVNMNIPKILGSLCGSYAQAQSFRDLNQWFQTLQDMHAAISCLPGFPTAGKDSEVEFVIADGALEKGVDHLLKLFPDPAAVKAFQGIANAGLLFMDIDPRQSLQFRVLSKNKDKLSSIDVYPYHPEGVWTWNFIENILEFYSFKVREELRMQGELSRQIARLPQPGTDQQRNSVRRLAGVDLRALQRRDVQTNWVHQTPEELLPKSLGELYQLLLRNMNTRCPSVVAATMVTGSCCDGVDCRQEGNRNTSCCAIKVGGGAGGGDIPAMDYLTGILGQPQSGCIPEVQFNRGSYDPFFGFDLLAGKDPCYGNAAGHIGPPVNGSFGTLAFVSKGISAQAQDCPSGVDPRSVEDVPPPPPPKDPDKKDNKPPPAPAAPKAKTDDCVGECKMDLQKINAERQQPVTPAPAASAGPAPAPAAPVPETPTPTPAPTPAPETPTPDDTGSQAAEAGAQGGSREGYEPRDAGEPRGGTPEADGSGESGAGGQGGGSVSSDDADDGCRDDVGFKQNLKSEPPLAVLPGLPSSDIEDTGSIHDQHRPTLDDVKSAGAVPVKGGDVQSQVNGALSIVKGQLSNLPDRNATAPSSAEVLSRTYVVKDVGEFADSLGLIPEPGAYAVTVGLRDGSAVIVISASQAAGIRAPNMPGSFASIFAHEIGHAFFGLNEQQAYKFGRGKLGCPPAGKKAPGGVGGGRGGYSDEGGSGCGELTMAELSKRKLLFCPSDALAMKDQAFGMSHFTNLPDASPVSGVGAFTYQEGLGSRAGRTENTPDDGKDRGRWDDCSAVNYSVGLPGNNLTGCGEGGVEMGCGTSGPMRPFVDPNPIEGGPDVYHHLEQGVERREALPSHSGQIEETPIQR